MDLADYGAVLDHDLSRLAASKSGLATGKESLALSSRAREHAIAALLVEDWVEGFTSRLLQSGVARLIFLEKTKDESANVYRCSSFFDPLLDAIAGGDLSMAARLVAATATSGPCGDSHDYYYSQMLHAFVAPDKRDLLSLMQEFESAGSSARTSRFAVCRALIEKDSGRFDTAFEEFLNAEERSRGKYVKWNFVAFERAFAEFGGLDAVLEVHNGIREDDESLEQLDAFQSQLRNASRQVCVEALALLQLAEHRGIKTQQEYRYCPEKARHLHNTQFDWAVLLK